MFVKEQLVSLLWPLEWNVAWLTIYHSITSASKNFQIKTKQNERTSQLTQQSNYWFYIFSFKFFQKSSNFLKLAHVTH